VPIAPRCAFYHTSIAIPPHFYRTHFYHTLDRSFITLPMHFHRTFIASHFTTHLHTLYISLLSHFKYTYMIHRILIPFHSTSIARICTTLYISFPSHVYRTSIAFPSYCQHISATSLSEFHRTSIELSLHVRTRTLSHTQCTVDKHALRNSKIHDGA